MILFNKKVDSLYWKINFQEYSYLTNFNITGSSPYLTTLEEVVEEAVAHDAPHGVEEAVAHDAPHGVEEAVAHDAPHGVEEVVAHDAPHGVEEVVAHDG